MFLVDANVLLDVFTDDPTWRPWSERAVGDALAAGVVGINPIIYAEVSLRFADADPLDRRLHALMVGRLPLPYDAAFGRAAPLSAIAARAACAGRRCPTSASARMRSPKT